MEKYPAGAFPLKALRKIAIELLRMKDDWRFGNSQIGYESDKQEAALIADKAIAKMCSI
ncbi:hypothetical protein NVP1184A_46 [Vibrio phage 1.184.A._10N.286.49.A5]|nr:hypothetical protein NVP1184A_46 [Vibrio phage 1.184.A._10N.286.49.A5]